MTAVAVAAALAGSALAGCNVGDPADAEAEIGAAKNEIAVRKAMDELVKAGYPGVLVTVKGKDGKVRDYSAGVGDRSTKKEPHKNAHIRIGSNTKTFTAAAVLQLVGEGKMELDKPVDTYLPGVVKGPDYDGARITVRQVLGHSTGIPDYTQWVDADTGSAPKKAYTAEQLLAPALKNKADFPAGDRREYSNTNYIIAGMLVEKLDGKPVGTAVMERTAKRLGLKDTTWPEPGNMSIPEPRMEGYGAAPGAELTSLTEMDPSVSGAAGTIISTPRDLNAFFAGLLDGKLMPAAQLTEMRKTVEAEGQGFDTVFGLGLDEITLSCGKLWGHGGDIHGFHTRGGVTTDGREVTVAVNALPTAIISENSDMKEMEKEAFAKIKLVQGLVDTAICK